MDSTIQQTTSNASETGSMRTMISISWIGSLIIVAAISYLFGRASMPVNQKPTEQKVMSANAVMASSTPVPTATPQTSPTPLPEKACSKTGFAQKWEYLTPYILKEGDSLQKIVETELNDASRLSEVIKLNNDIQLALGVTLYLPPASVTKSSGNIRQVNGRLVDKNESMWYISFNADKKGQGLLIPTFWFESLTNKGLYNVGDCLTVLFDDGYKVFSVSTQDAKSN